MAKNTPPVVKPTKAQISAFPSATLSDIAAKKEAVKKVDVKTATKEASKPAKTAKEQAKTIANEQAKPADSTAAKPAKADTKPAIQAPVKPEYAVKYALVDYTRPKGGLMLFAFTAAWLDLFNMFNGQAIPENVLVQVCGKRAISYHTHDTKTLEMTPKGIALTAHGLNYFQARKEGRIPGQVYSAKVADAFKEMMLTGKVDGILVKDSLPNQPRKLVA